MDATADPTCIFTFTDPDAMDSLRAEVSHQACEVLRQPGAIDRNMARRLARLALMLANGRGPVEPETVHVQLNTCRSCTHLEPDPDANGHQCTKLHAWLRLDTGDPCEDYAPRH